MTALHPFRALVFDEFAEQSYTILKTRQKNASD